MRNKIHISDYEKQVYSQHWEDGMLEKIFEILNVKKGTFVEFGGWDGIKYSNVYNLVKNGWSGLYIEADKGRSDERKKNMKDFDNVFSHNSRISLEPGERIDEILSEYDIFNNGIDFMCIDIDGNDYWVWSDMEKYKPDVIIIEFNRVFGEQYTTILYDKNYSNKRPHYGASANALVRLGKEKGYDLIAEIPVNLVFIKRELNTGIFDIITEEKDKGFVKIREDVFDTPTEQKIQNLNNHPILINPPFKLEDVK